MATNETQVGDRDTLDMWPDDDPSRDRQLEAALLALGVRPATRPYEPRPAARQRPAWRAFLARKLGI